MLCSMWHNPLPLRLRVTDESESFRDCPDDMTELPVYPHPGAFGVQRRHHVHEGIDLYCESGTPVFAVEPGQVVAVLPFTGPDAGLPWWLDTQAVLVEGASGVVVYGEINALARAGDSVAAGQTLGHVTRVLRRDKGRPTSMLHLELHTAGTRHCKPWDRVESRPLSLRDPTQHLRQLCT